MTKDNNSKHRERVKRRLLNDGLENFEPHEILELALFYAIPRVDTKPMAKALLREFGSLSDVFNAPYDELRRIDGIGPGAALFIKFIPQICREYLLSAQEAVNLFKSDEEIITYLRKLYVGLRVETVYILTFDSRGKLLATTKLFEGNINSVQFSLRTVMEVVFKHSAVTAVIAHNHPSGNAVPSADDILTTYKIYDALSSINVQLADHVICTDDDAISFKQSGYFSEAKRRAYINAYKVMKNYND